MRFGALPDMAPLVELADRIRADVPDAKPKILWVDGCIDGKVTSAFVSLAMFYNTPSGTGIFVSAELHSLEEWDQLFASIKAGEKLERQPVAEEA